MKYAFYVKTTVKYLGLYIFIVISPLQLKASISQKLSINSLKKDEQNISEISKQLYRLRKEIHSIDREIIAIQRNLETTLKLYQEQYEVLKSNVRLIYDQKTNLHWRLFLHPDDYKRHTHLIRVFKHINDTQNEKMIKILENSKKLIRMKVLLEQKKRDKEKIYKKIQKEHAYLKDIYEKGKINLKKYKNKNINNDNLKIIKSYEHSTNNDTDSFFMKNKGKLIWPVHGKIIKKIHHKLSDGFESRGILIDVKEGFKVKSIADGRVVIANWFIGYGWLVVVKHDDQDFSIYAHNKRLLVKRGDIVKAGQAIALVGKSKGLDKAVCHFGMRHRGQALDPTYWLSPK